MRKRLELALPLHHHHVGRRARSVFAVGQVEKTAWGQAVRRFKHRVPRPRRKCDKPRRAHTFAAKRSSYFRWCGFRGRAA